MVVPELAATRGGACFRHKQPRPLTYSPAPFTATTTSSDVFDVIEIASPQTQASTTEARVEETSEGSGSASLSATTSSETAFEKLLKKQAEIEAQLEALKAHF